MFFYTPLSQDNPLYETIDAELRAFLIANFDKLLIQDLSIGQGISTIIFCDVGAGHTDFIGSFDSILTSHDCYVDGYVMLHGHYDITFGEHSMATAAQLSCIHYKIEAPASVGGRPRAPLYIGRLDQGSISADLLKNFNKMLWKKYRRKAKNGW